MEAALLQFNELYTEFIPCFSILIFGPLGMRFSDLIQEQRDTGMTQASYHQDMK